jgi:hypothetical protein
VSPELYSVPGTLPELCGVPGTLCPKIKVVAVEDAMAIAGVLIGAEYFADKMDELMYCSGG